MMLLINANSIDAKQILRILVVFSITVAMYMRTSHQLCATLFHCGHLLFTWKIHYGLIFHFDQINPSEVCTEVSFALP